VDGAVVLLALTALAFTARTFVATRPTDVGTSAQLGSPVPLFDSLARMASVLHRGTLGDTLIVVTDFQCPFCLGLAVRLDSLISEFKAKAPTILILHLPLDNIHPLARLSAVAAECAASNGAFRQVHDALFAARARIVAGDSAVVMSVLQPFRPVITDECVKSPAISARVAAHVAAARGLRVRGTPTVLLNSHWIEGNPTLEDLRRLLR
jgi:protein-disulfide isomerase